jgi:hypothetical protein
MCKISYSFSSSDGAGKSPRPLWQEGGMVSYREGQRKGWVRQHPPTSLCSTTTWPEPPRGNRPSFPSPPQTNPPPSSTGSSKSSTSQSAPSTQGRPSPPPPPLGPWDPPWRHPQSPAPLSAKVHEKECRENGPQAPQRCYQPPLPNEEKARGLEGWLQLPPPSRNCNGIRPHALQQAPSPASRPPIDTAALNRGPATPFPNEISSPPT